MSWAELSFAISSLVSLVLALTLVLYGAHRSRVSGPVALVFLLGVLASLGSCAAPQVRTISAFSVSLAGEQALRLDGEWEFFPGDAVKSRPLTVPGVWDRVESPNGWGTYRLQLTGLTVGRIYSVQFKGLNSRGEISLDNRPLGIWGPGINFVPRTYHWVADRSVSQLRVDITNPDMASGGLWLPVVAGPVAAVELQADASRFGEIVLIGAVVMMALYHLALFWFRPKDRAPLAFAIFCFLSALKASISGEQILTLMIPAFDQALGLRLAYLDTILLPLVFLFYLQQIYPSPKTPWWLMGLGVTGLIQAVVSILAPLPVVQAWFFPYQILIVFACVQCVTVLAGALRRKEPGALVMLSGFLLMFAAAVNDILHDNKIIVTFYSLNLGLFLFLFSQALVMGGLFSRTQRKLEELNSTLEQRVAERTLALETLSRQDPLTGLLNRRYFWTLLTQEWERWARYGQDFCVVMVDIDHFKRINDTSGHAAGDEALLRVTQVLSQSVRKTDVVARYGGEEFCLLLPGVTTAEAFQALEKIRLAVATGPLTISYGLVQASKYPSAQAALDQADKLMYHSKESGRNQGTVDD